jgi:hypothetical protein
MIRRDEQSLLMASHGKNSNIPGPSSAPALCIQAVIVPKGGKTVARFSRALTVSGASAIFEA